MGRKTPPEFEIEIERLVWGGEAMGYFEGRPVFVFGALPGEIVRVFPLKIRRGTIRAGLAEIVRPSPDRRPARDEAFRSTSPFQIWPEEKQNSWKPAAALEMWRKLGGDPPAKNPVFHEAPQPWEYRNKMEFSFDENGDLAFHQRFSHYRMAPAAGGSAIAHPGISAAGAAVAAELREQKIDPKVLKSLTVRASFSEKKIIASLAVRDRDFAIFQPRHPLAGFEIIFSRPESPATTRDAVLASFGENFLTENLAGTALRYPGDGFFQINPPATEKFLRWLRDAAPGRGILVDLYAGVGTLGIFLAKNFAEVRAVEVHAAAVDFARENAEKNGAKNFTAVAIESEKADLPGILAGAETVVVDPPRAGLHPRVAEILVKNGPENLIYVSCNPATQARDWAILGKKYRAAAWDLWDFYPQTPHLESVIVARRG